MKKDKVKVVNPLTPMKEQQKTFYPNLEIIEDKCAPQKKIHIMPKSPILDRITEKAIEDGTATMSFPSLKGFTKKYFESYDNE